MDIDTAPSESGVAPPKKRGEGRGSNFFVLDRDIWEALWKAPTKNRMNFVTAFLVLLAGTGADHRLTKWSTKACEERAGMGKPRAKIAIEELIEAGLAEYTPTSSRTFPQYRLADLKSKSEPIFLPVQLVTGFGTETAMLRRIRETGDAMLLRMAIDLYGLIETDATHGVSIERLRQYDNTAEASRKITQMGANTVWALSLGRIRQGNGKWREVQTLPKAKNDDQPFWPRFETLEQIGALWFEPWVFASDQLDAEPLFPVSHASFGGTNVGKEVSLLSSLISATAEELIGDRRYLIEQNSDKLLLPLPSHHGAPALRGVARLRVEADTPGRRLSFAKRMGTLERATKSFGTLYQDARTGKYNQPLKLS